MKNSSSLALFSSSLILFALAAHAQTRTGQAAFNDYSQQAPGVSRKLTVADLPKPYATEAVDNGPEVVRRPDNAWPKTLPGFKVDLYSTGLDNPRLIRTAPNGDLFVAESRANRIKLFRGVTSQGKVSEVHIFATGFRQPFGIAFYPLGPNPKWVYVGNTDSVVRIPYQVGDTEARGKAEVVVQSLPGGGHLRGGGHWTRDIAFSKDGSRMWVSVGSVSNVDDTDTNPAEFHRADVLEFTPEGQFKKVYVWGVRNAVGIAVNPTTGELWGSVNERDNLGDNLVPDYITHFTEGGFYGWPWFYMGGTQDPRHNGKHPELKSKVLTPDILLQPHDASLEMTFDENSKFPAEYRGDIFAAEHGSWNRAKRSGYEVICAPMHDGHTADGSYEDFVTGFVTNEGRVWGRPVGVAFGNDGALYITDDGSNSIWRVSYVGSTPAAPKPH